MLGYKELKMGATIYSYLVGYNDPRTEKYFVNFEQVEIIL
ncbi:MAG: SusD/RagB family nutrient-binding outer membrane lipoprotein [Granulicatella sp.]